MRVLAFDTSSDTLTAGLYEDDKILAQESSSGFARHSEVLMPALEKLFRYARLTSKQVDLIAVGLGPGSFTGLRVGITTAKMLGFAAKKKIVGIPSFEILAASQEIEGPVAVLRDAKKNKIYALIYRGAAGSKKTELTELKKFLPSVPRGAAVLAGIVLDSFSRELLRRKNCRVISEPKPASAFYEARLAAFLAQKKRFTALDDLKPLYLYPKNCNATKNKK